MKAGCSSSGFSPLDTALLNTAMNTPVAPIQTFKDEKNPFSPEQYPNVDEDMFPPLTPNINNPEASTIVPIPTQNYLLFGGVCYQPVPTPHNVVVSQSTIPKPALVPAPTEPSPNATSSVVPAEILLPATDTETNGSDLSVPLIETHFEAPEPKPKPEVKKDQEFVAIKAPFSSGSTKVRRKSRPRSRSSSSRNSDSSRVHRPQGVSPSGSLTNAKRVRGIGRGKAKEAANPMPTPSSIPLAGTTLPRENLRITIPAGDGQRKVEIVPDYPANVAHLVKLEDEA